MNNIIRMLSSGIAALGTPLVKYEYPKESATPFSDDRRALRGDWEQIRKDLSKGIERVRKEHEPEATRR